MNRQKLFEQSIGRLADAYFDDRLEAGDPCGCAVGSICTSNYWYNKLRAYRRSNSYDGQITRLGYTNEEIDRIERAFEQPPETFPTVFQRLKSVVDELLDIHGAERPAEEEIEIAHPNWPK